MNICGFSATTPNGSYANIEPHIVGDCIAIGITSQGQLVFVTNNPPSEVVTSKAEFVANLRRLSTNYNY